MRIGVKTRQILAVTAIVFIVVATMGALSLVSIADGLVKDTRARADLLANGIFNRAAQLALEGGDLGEALATDPGLQSILQMSGLSRHALYAAIVDTGGRVIVHSDPTQVGRVLPEHPSLDGLVDAGPLSKTRAVFTPGGLTREVRLPLTLGTTDFGSIRVAVSTLLMRDDLEQALRPAAWTALLLLLASVVIATVLAQWTLRPILLIRAGLDRLGRGESGVTLALPESDEFADLGESFNVVSARLTQEEQEGRISRASVSRRLAALGRVSSGIAHEVKNPLNAMRIHLELLRMQTAGDNDHVKVLAQQMRRLDEVVQGFLTFARPDALTLEAVPLSEVFDDMRPVVEAEASKTGVLVTMGCPPDLPPVLADAGQLQQALLNLAINACQAMPEGGELRVSARTAGASRVEITIEDNGVGIAAEDLDKIFNLYFTTKPEGSGVGLALVYRTIHLLDGDIEVESVPGQGTTFRVTLPVAARA